MNLKNRSYGFEESDSNPFMKIETNINFHEDQGSPFISDDEQIVESETSLGSFISP